MPRSEHTAGPWEARWTSVRATARVFATSVYFGELATCWDGGEISTKERDANARLIAAAPDMLEALELVMREEVLAVGVEMIVSSAIAKAKGE